MLNSFGKLLRSYRTQLSMKLKDLADVLNVSDSYLSAAEYGRRPVPDTWFETLKKYFNLDGNAAVELKRAIDETKSSVTIPLGKANDTLRREVKLAFAQFVADADEPTLEEFREFMLSKRYTNDNWKRSTTANDS